MTISTNPTNYDPSLSSVSVQKNKPAAEAENTSAAAPVSNNQDTLELSSEYKESNAMSYEANEYLLYKESESIRISMYTMNGKLTDSMLAEHYADLGKRLDELHSNGKLSEDEYDMLNVELNSYIDEKTSATENLKAHMHICRERGKMSPAEYTDYMKERHNLTPEEYQANLKSQIKELVESTYKIDREALMKMVYNLRYGIINK